jgi:hypothetical protein
MTLRLNPEASKTLAEILAAYKGDKRGFPDHLFLAIARIARAVMEVESEEFHMIPFWIDHYTAYLANYIRGSDLHAPRDPRSARGPAGRVIAGPWNKAPEETGEGES